MIAGKEKYKLRQMIKEYGVKDINNVYAFVKMTANPHPELDAELEKDLGYLKYDYKNKPAHNHSE